MGSGENKGISYSALGPPLDHSAMISKGMSRITAKLNSHEELWVIRVPSTIEPSTLNNLKINLKNGKAVLGDISIVSDPQTLSDSLYCLVPASEKGKNLQYRLAHKISASYSIQHETSAEKSDIASNQAPISLVCYPSKMLQTLDDFSSAIPQPNHLRLRSTPIGATVNLTEIVSANKKNREESEIPEESSKKKSKKSKK